MWLEEREREREGGEKGHREVREEEKNRERERLEKKDREWRERIRDFRETASEIVTQKVSFSPHKMSLEESEREREREREREKEGK
jgi:hypothetical protein